MNCSSICTGIVTEGSTGGLSAGSWYCTLGSMQKGGGKCQDNQFKAQNDNGDVIKICKIQDHEDSCYVE
jgi:hypothetical protein